jgi:hypothetical protein
MLFGNRRKKIAAYDEVIFLEWKQQTSYVLFILRYNFINYL